MTTDLTEWITAAREKESIEDLHTALNALETLGDVALVWHRAGKHMINWADNNTIYGTESKAVRESGEAVRHAVSDIMQKVMETLE